MKRKTWISAGIIIALLLQTVTAFAVIDGTENPQLGGAIKVKTSAAVPQAGLIPTGEYPSEAEIQAYAKAHPFTDNKTNWDKTTFAIQPNTGKGIIGKISERSQQQALNYLNLARYCVGLPEVQLNDEYSNLAQHAAFQIADSGVMSHNPTEKGSHMTDEQFELAKKGASHSNLYGGASDTPVEQVQSYLSDWNNASNSGVGHRLWCLGNIGKTGFGSVASGRKGGAAMWALNRYSYSNNYADSCCIRDYIAWPSQNFPVEFLSKDEDYYNDSDVFYNTTACQYIWSCRLGSQYTIPDESKLKVVVKNQTTGKTYSVTKATSISDRRKEKGNWLQVEKASGYGYWQSSESNVIEFVPYLKNCLTTCGAYFEGFKEYTDKEDEWYRIGDQYEVTITGIQKNGAEAVIQYPVNFMSVLGQKAQNNSNYETEKRNALEERAWEIFAKTHPNEEWYDNSNYIYDPIKDTIVKKPRKEDVAGDQIKTGAGNKGRTFKITSISKRTVKLVKLTGKETKVVVPDRVISAKSGKSYKVTSVGDNLLKGNKKITNLTIGKYVTTIGKAAFQNCRKLKNITVKGNLTSVQAAAFKGIPSKAKVTVYAADKIKYSKIKSKLQKTGLSKAKFNYKSK